MNPLIPDWELPAGIHAASTTREGGVSHPPFDTLNLATHVGDDPAAVAANRQRLVKDLGLPAEPAWLNQVHGIRVAEAGREGQEADAVVGRHPGDVCAVLTADCLPVLFCDPDRRIIAAAHAGWRGLAAGVLESTLAAMGSEPQAVTAWLGPGIGPASFEVGEDVVAAFTGDDPAAAAAFRRRDATHWLADIYDLARLRLERAGVAEVTGGGLDTCADSNRFFSYRRDGETGRMACLIWLDGE